MIQLFGISNCDRVTKAKKTLNDANVEFEYIDFRKDNFSTNYLEDWLKKVSITDVISQRSAAWQKLTTEERDNLLNDPCLKCIANNPTLIKRPVLVTKNNIYFGFNQKVYDEVVNNV